MDLFAFPPIALLLDGAYALVQGIATLLNPFAGTASAAIAIVVLTLLVRTALIPVGASQVKAEWHRRRIAPKLQSLQRKYKKNPQLLQQKTAALYKAENVSPFAGFLPTLLQAPVISLVYALFIRTTIDGHPNELLGEHVGGVTLGSSVFNSGWPGVLVFLALFAAIGVTAWFSRRTALSLALPNPDATPAVITTQKVLSWLPFITVLFAALVPLAAVLYLATTTLWTLLERSLLRRRYWGETGSLVPAPAP
ncbi:MAG: YidC/Oxa1 family membrane protein insertase [Rhodoglobus sp.]